MYNHNRSAQVNEVRCGLGCIYISCSNSYKVIKGTCRAQDAELTKPKQFALITASHFTSRQENL